MVSLVVFISRVWDPLDADVLWRKCGSREFIVPEVGVRGASWDRIVEDTVRMLVDLEGTKL